MRNVRKISFLLNFLHLTDYLTNLQLRIIHMYIFLHVLDIFEIENNKAI